MEVVFLLIGLAVGGAIGFFGAQRISQKVKAQVDVLNNTVQNKDHEIEQLKTNSQEKLQEQKENFERLLESERLTKEKLQNEFKATAAQTLQENTRQYLNEAIKDLRQVKSESDESLNKKSVIIDEMVKEVKNRVQKSEELIRQFEQERKEIYGNLKQGLQSVLEAENVLRMETQSLKTAIQGSSQYRGKWGEMVLKNILDQSGLLEGVHYTANMSSETTGERSRPDVLIHLDKNDGQNLVIDSKANLSDFLKAAETDDQAQRKALVDGFLKAVKAEIRNLASRDYSKTFNSRSNVIMFIPTESAVRLLFQADPAIFEYASSHGVSLASPIIIIPLIQIISSNLKSLKIADEIFQYRDQMGTLADRLTKFSEHLEKVKRGIETAAKSLNDASGSWGKMVRPQLQKLEKLEDRFGKVHKISPIQSPHMEVEEYSKESIPGLE